MTPFLQEGRTNHVVDRDQKSSKNSFIYRSKAIEGVINTVNQGLKQNRSLLIVGEMGVGKNHLARYIHSKSPARFGSFKVIDCAILSPKVLESELFGFYGDKTTDSLEGALRLADGGTLLIRDITKMPTPLQEKFCEFLKTGQVYPVQSKRSIPVNVQIIYSLSSEKELSEGCLIKKLYQKINPVHVRIPNLYDRREDIEDLIKYFLSFDLVQHGTSRKKYSVTSSAMEMLKWYKWPGNVGEVRSVCERLQVFCPTGEITVKDLPKQIVNSEDFPINLKYDPHLSLSDINRIYILQALRHFSSKKKAAEALGITVKTLYNRLHEYGVFEKYAVHPSQEQNI